MRLSRFTALTILATGLAATPAAAQAWDPNYPVCMQVFGRLGGYNECRYTSIEQCNLTASGRPAQCIVNPFYAPVTEQPPARRDARHKRHYRRD
jgi:hypothetical protein